MTIAVRFFSLAIGLVFGLFQTAFIIGKANGIDIREHGSGNSGSTNALRVLGTKMGFLTLFGDSMKTLAAMLIVRFTFGRMYPDISVLLVMYAAMGCILSHDFPFYMKFKGGKGIACTAGLFFGLEMFNPLFTPIGFIVFLIPFLTTHYVSLGSLLVYVSLIILFSVFGFNGWMGNFSDAVIAEGLVICVILMCLAYFLHRKNILRLISGTESKTYLSKKRREAYKAEMAAKQAAAEASVNAEVSVNDENK